ncbi:hypothetical protein BH10ACT1_BH10ACT1_21100 [soil metagenome]
MALREKLAERAQPYLEPGEQVRHVFMGQTGPNPFLAALSWLIILIAGKYFIFVVTDRAILVLNASKWVPSKAKGIEARLPRATQIGPVSGIWGQTHALGQRVWINKRFHKDVQAADAELAGNPPTPPIA